jgi:Proton-conducting membrane transporter
LQPVIERSDFAMSFLVCVGISTALFGMWVGFTQQDVKSGQAFAIASQIGLMFMECGFGLWKLAFWHMIGHATIRSYFLLSAPSIMEQTLRQPIASVSDGLKFFRMGFVLSLHRGWLEEFIHWIIVKPLMLIAKDIHILDKTVTTAAFQVAPSLGVNNNLLTQNFGRGLWGWICGKASSFCGEFEERFILRGVGDSLQMGRRLGQKANQLERLLLKPRYLALFVLTCIIFALESG